MKRNIFLLVLVFIILILSGCGNPSATTPPSVNVSINKYFITGTAPSAAITSSVNNPFTNNLSVVSLVSASKTTFLTITKTTSTTNPTYSESITSSTAASFNALMAGPTQVTVGKGNILASTNNPFAGEDMLRRTEAELLKSGASTQPLNNTIGIKGLTAMNAIISTPGVGSTAAFWVNKDLSGLLASDVSVTATCVYVGTNAYIYVDNTSIAYATISTNAASISAAFDSIYATDTSTFGSEYKPGIDGDNHVTILISPAVNNYDTNGTLGYFWGRDEYTVTSNGTYTDHSNMREMFYTVDVTGGVSIWADASTNGPNSKKGYAILAHEFQHMINWNQKGRLAGKSEDTWLNEALSMYAMQACGYGLPQNDPTVASQVSSYLTWPETTSLTNWATNNAHYGGSYLFMLYLVEHYGGSGILTGMESNALTGIANVESVTGTGTFGLVFKNWAMANYLDHITTNNTYNYTSINLHSTYVTSGGTYALNGAQLATTAVTTYPYNVNANQPGWSAMYQQYTNATNALNISIQNNSGYNYLEGVVLVQ